MLELLKPQSAAPFAPVEAQEEDNDWHIFPWELPGVRNYNPKVYMLMAPRGRGKTVAMTAMAKFMLSAYQAKKVNVDVLSNYFVKFARISDPFLLDRMIEFPQWARRKLILIDEITEFTPSSRAMSNSSRDVASFIRQIRKREIDVITNTQFPIEVDRRILRQTDLFIEVDMQWRRRGPGEKGPALKADVDLYIYDYWGNYNRSNWGKARKWPPSRDEADRVMTIENVHTVFPLFNTREIQVSMWTQNRDAILEGEGWQLNSEEEEIAAEPMPGVTSVRAGNSFDEFLLERERPGGGLNVNGLYHDAREWHKEWKAPKDFQAWLAENGWQIEVRTGGPNRVLAFRV